MNKTDDIEKWVDLTTECRTFESLLLKEKYRNYLKDLAIKATLEIDQTLWDKIHSFYPVGISPYSLVNPEGNKKNII